METDSGFRFHWKLRPPPQQPNIPGFPLGNSRLDLALKNVPLFPDSRLQQPRATKQNVSQNQFNYLPGGVPPAVSLPFISPIEKYPAGPFFVGQQKSPVTARKRFLVFDRSGDKTTLVYTSGEHFGGYLPNPPMVHNMCPPVRPDEEDAGDNSDEMREDTEELNALLCSDSDSDFSDDDEVTSAAHSPSTMTGDYNNGHALVEEICEEVRSLGPAKRRKLYDGAYDMLSSSHAATSCLKTSGAGSDAESSCSNCNEQLSGRKRSQKEIIRGTLSILRDVIPDGEGKDAADVISDAICYLKSLKAKAAALGLDSL